MDKTIIKFPWYGVVCSLTYILLLLMLSDQHSVEILGQFTTDLLSQDLVKLFLFGVVLIAFTMDYFRCKKVGEEFDERLQSREAQLDELFKSKYALQNKAHRYSGHADKLKLFISDKLLEYIEYDEKFLHFKNIASEVRHNGVISYDLVTSLLKESLEKIGDTDERIKYQKALNSMIYLWDLLDLSTTDNIALYIANKLYECEELYYRKVLDDEHETPFAPSFPVKDVIIKSLEGFVQDNELYLSNLDNNKEETYRYDDNQIRACLENAGDFFGNENYIILVMENLLNNALYYSDQKKYKNQYAKLSLSLTSQGEFAVIKIYNPGPLVPDDVKDKIYQLGFSSKRSKGNQGKGLGLYFVKQIVSGYEGNIDFNNITNKENKYIIRVECKSGTVVNQIIEVVQNPNGKLSCKMDDEAINKSFRFNIKESIKGIEISPHNSKQTHSFYKFNASGETTFLDPELEARPTWLLFVREKSSSAEITFKPLDTTGVEFVVEIPTAASRMESDYHNDDVSSDESKDLFLEDDY
ncbi:MAG: sensor histidine kinase [Gammaproteobacteria bacterium]|nr:sensor histidine kinase [Gammaproteobacteria bacterium]